MNEKPTADTTTAALTYLHQQLDKLGDTYTATVLADLTACVTTSTVAPTAALKTVAALLAHQHPADARQAVRQATRVMAIEALADSIDLLYGRGTDVSVHAAHTRLQQDGCTAPEQRVHDALVRRHHRHLGTT